MGGFVDGHLEELQGTKGSFFFGCTISYQSGVSFAKFFFKFGHFKHFVISKIDMYGRENKKRKIGFSENGGWIKWGLWFRP